MTWSQSALSGFDMTMSPERTRRTSLAVQAFGIAACDTEKSWDVARPRRIAGTRAI